MPYKDYEQAKARDRWRYRNLSLEQKKDRVRRKTEWRRHERQSLIDWFGGKCIRCGFDDPRALQFDHINGDSGGRKGRPARERLWKEIKAEPHRFQLLCANCNSIKRYECGELN